MAAKKLPIRSAKPVTNSLNTPIHSAVDLIFQKNDAIRKAIATNLKGRSSAAREFTRRARKAFENFNPSRHSSNERAGRNYLKKGQDLAPVQKHVFDKGIDAIKQSKVNRSLRLIESDGLKKFINKTAGAGDLTRTINTTKLRSYIDLNSQGGNFVANDSIITACKAEIEAERITQEVLGHVPHKDSSGASHRAARDQDALHLAAATQIKQHVDLQMKTATSPESQLRYDIPDPSDQLRHFRDTPARSDQMKGTHDKPTFELRSGASDVTAYHDFYSLQIAFEDVWTEMFDGQLTYLGQQLYEEYVKLKDFNGIDKGKDYPISSTADLRKLMDEIKNLSSLTQDSIPPEFHPNAGSSKQDGTPGSFTSNDFLGGVKDTLDPLGAIADAIGDKTVKGIVQTADGILNPAGWFANIVATWFASESQITWESFPGPLPLNDKISVDFAENAVGAGAVQIVLMNTDDTWWWKGIEFREFDPTGKVKCDFKISTDPNDKEVSDPANYNRVSIYTSQLTNGTLEFKKQVTGEKKPCYMLAGLDGRIKDRMRVTFTWTKD
jgi:hypothetical protein